MARAPQNAWTAMIERVAAMNQTGEFVGGGLSSVDPRPTVSSASMGRVTVVEEPPPLSAQEQAELDAKAAALGIMPPTEGDGPYATMEDALRAAGVDPDAPPAPTVDPVMTRMAGTGRLSARHPNLTRPPQAVVVQPRFPDFTKPESIDLQEGIALIDGMAFPVPPENLRRFKQFVIELAKRELVKKLEEAIGLFAREVTSDQGTTQGEGKEVQRVPEGGS